MEGKSGFRAFDSRWEPSSLPDCPALLYLLRSLAGEGQDAQQHPPGHLKQGLCALSAQNFMF
jgi:hypothetical protein